MDARCDGIRLAAADRRLVTGLMLAPAPPPRRYPLFSDS